VNGEHSNTPASVSTDQCCEGWAHAQHSGTDNEGYGRLLYDCANPQWRVAPRTKPPEWQMGSGLPPVKFCPWCGAKKS
jgi:hypothetical protein